VKRLICKKVLVLKYGYVFTCIYKKCNRNRNEAIMNHILQTLLNIGFNNFTILLNRKENVKKLSLKVVKLRNKKMKDAANSTVQNIDSNDINYWSSEKCKSFLKIYNAHCIGNVQTLKDYYFLLSKLIENNL